LLTNPSCIQLQNSISGLASKLVNPVRIFSSLALFVVAVMTSPGQAAVACNPVVEPLSSDTTLISTLSRVATEYDFKLTLPESLDRPIRFDRSMALERLIKRLTRGMNTVLKHRKVEGCATPVLTHLIVLPIGKQTELSVNQPPEEEQTVDYIYIDNMESYVADVLEGRQQADLRRMTPEQREEFKIAREAMISKQAAEAAQSEQIENTAPGDTITPGQAPAVGN
jgi:hypothetical protein